MLPVLVDLIRGYSCPDLEEAPTISVDVNDLASFIGIVSGSVRCTSILLTCLGLSKFQRASNKLQLLTTDRNWTLVDDAVEQQPNTRLRLVDTSIGTCLRCRRHQRKRIHLRVPFSML